MENHYTVSIRRYTDILFGTWDLYKRPGWLVYPYSDQAAGVAQVLEMEARHQKVKIKTTEEVTDILREDDRYLVKTATWKYPCDSVIVACGSPASNVEGSSATGYALAENWDTQ